MLIDARKKELLVLYTIIQKETCTLQELATTLSIPKRTIKEIIRKLNGTIFQYLKIANFIQSTAKGTIQTIEPSLNDKMTIFYKVKLFYLQESNRFKFLLLLFNYPDAHVPKKILLEQLYISPSYLEKLKRQLNKVLGRFQLQLVSRQNCYMITGNELFLRVFMYHFFSESFQGVQWPLKSLRYSSVKKEKLLSHELLTKTAIKQYENRFLLMAIFMIRSKLQNLDDPTMLSTYEIMRIIYQTKNFSGEFKQHFFSIFPQNITMNEIIIFNFLLCYFFPNLVSDQQKTLFGYELSKSNHPICRKTSLLVKKLADSYPFIGTPEKKYYYGYFIIMRTSFILLLEKNVEDFQTLFFPKKSPSKAIEDSQLEKIKALIECVYLHSPHKEILTGKLSQLIHTLLHAEEKKEIFIHFQIDKPITGNYYIKNRLKNLFNEQFLHITETPEKADLIITDEFEISQKNAEIFYLDPHDENESWSKLINLIKKMYLN
ncbi:helix-turn-helix domain-containing protein [Enterococcus durans]|uniref:helix-turn-helix domain-containing protein n=1 Tax=Enterococcus durans TaxID=53345 RepID=UPI001CD80485|nr:helix-turn-helix domain-containing protein [Enterococcus durans]